MSRERSLLIFFTSERIMDLLLLSNSTNFGELFLEFGKPLIDRFLPVNCGKIIFIPYAGIRMSYDEYTGRVTEALKGVNPNVTGIHTFASPADAIAGAGAIMIGGGNSFRLLDQLQKNNLLEPIRDRVRKGIPYIGWSAGSNMACPTLMTTNDMPVVTPAGFKALGLIGYQINPHYTEKVIPGHGGESRDIRLLEFIEMNRNSRVVGLPEGMAIQMNAGTCRLHGEKGAKVFQYGSEPRWIYTDEDLNQFIRPDVRQ